MEPEHAPGTLKTLDLSYRVVAQAGGEWRGLCARFPGWPSRDKRSPKDGEALSLSYRVLRRDSVRLYVQAAPLLSPEDQVSPHLVEGPCPTL